MTEPLMNCLKCLSSDCGIYYRPLEDAYWEAYYQCSVCGERAIPGIGANHKDACAIARVHWQIENGPEAYVPKPAGE